MKKALIVVLVLGLVGGVVYFFTKNNSVEDKTVNSDAVSENGRRIGSSTPTGQQPDKIKAVNFSGKLEKVDTGCFADGECFIEVGGKHVTVMVGWSQEIVGSVLGVEGFGDLEKHIGQEVEVYAQDKGDDTYTLYGYEGFYVKVK